MHGIVKHLGLLMDLIRNLRWMQKLDVSDCGVAGCTDAAACNYNADATTDDGSCTYAAEGFDCDR